MNTKALSNIVLHTSKALMSEQDNAVVGKRALQTLIETLAGRGIKCHIKVHKKDNMLVTQCYARIGYSLVPIGHADIRDLANLSPLAEYSLNYYLKDDPAEYSYDIVAYCKADAIEAAAAFCSNRNVTPAMLVDSEDNFIWEL